MIGDKYMFENNLKICREDLNMTQKELGNILNVHRKTITNWENSIDPISLEKLVIFCNLYNYSLDYVLGLSRRNTRYSNIITLNKEKIGLRLKKLRKNLNLSQLEFANKCGLAQRTYSNYETGFNLITTTNLYIICKTYNISMDYILRKSKEKTRV